MVQRAVATDYVAAVRFAQPSGFAPTVGFAKPHVSEVRTDRIENGILL